MNCGLGLRAAAATLRRKYPAHMDTLARDHSGSFKPTRWSLVLRAADPQTPTATRALDELCRAYWYPLYCFARRRGLAPPDAEDATQAFFARILESEMLARADPEKGLLRTYLLTAFQRFLISFDEHRFAQKRGGRLGPLSLNDAETNYQEEPADQHTPEKLFQQRWALTVLANTLAALESECAAEGRARDFAEFRPFLAYGQEESPDSYRTIAARLGMTAGAARITVHRIRKRYRELLFAQIADTLSDPSPAAINEEIRALFAALS
jgi:RNA polymerase sigma-70 factor (ECF subfamily)